jgi:precorrin-2/cobalt-factor-2 C20-methyltransferase
MNQPLGILFGLGMGPGDPDLLTLKAAKILSCVDVVLAASSTKNEHSLALSIAAPHLPPGVPTVKLGFPMTRDKAVLDLAWRDNAETALGYLRQGKNAAFLTLGDPMTYSTFCYLLRAVKAAEPNAIVRAVPGITAPQAAAAVSGVPLAESGQSFAVISGVSEPEKIRVVLGAVDSAAILKTYRSLPKIRALLGEMGLSGKARFVTRLGMDGERVSDDLSSVEDTPSYFSLILVKK